MDTYITPIITCTVKPSNEYIKWVTYSRHDTAGSKWLKVSLLITMVAMQQGIVSNFENIFYINFAVYQDIFISTSALIMIKVITVRAIIFSLYLLYRDTANN